MEVGLIDQEKNIREKKKQNKAEIERKKKLRIPTSTTIPEKFEQNS